MTKRVNYGRTMQQLADIFSMLRHQLLFFPLAILLSVFFTPLSLGATTIEKPADVRILIDVSGSMKQNDPRNLRRPALDLLINLLPEGSRAGVWTFGRYVNMLVPHAEVNDAWRTNGQAKLSLINSVALHTNIGLALEKANYDANAKVFPSSLDYSRSIILLTDGVVDIDSNPSVNQTETQRIQNEILDSYKQAGVVIHTVALSTNADAELLELLANETNGSFSVAEDASDLNRIFLNALERAAPADRVPLENNRFQIDSSIEEFTALVFRKPGAVPTVLKSPAGDHYDANSKGASVRWLSSEAYDLVTIKQPVEGEWQIDTAVDPDNRVSVVSNLAVNVAPLKKPLFVGDNIELELQLTQDSELIIDKNFLELIDVSASIYRNDRGEFYQIWRGDVNGDAYEPGVYARVIQPTDMNGEHELNILVDGKTFKREKTLQFIAKPAFELQAGYDADNNQAVVKINILNPDWQAANLSFSGFGSSAKTNNIPLNFFLSENNEWIAKFTPADNGEYQFEVTARHGAVRGGTMESKYDIEIPAAFIRPEITPLPVVADASVESLIEEMEPEPVQPEPAPEPEIKKEPEPAQASEPEAEEEGMNTLLLIGALVLGNILMIGGLYFLYRKVTAEPAPVEEPSVSKEPSANGEPSANKEALANEVPAVDEEPSAHEEPSADNEPSAEAEVEASEKAPTETQEEAGADTGESSPEAGEQPLATEKEEPLPSESSQEPEQEEVAEETKAVKAEVPSEAELENELEQLIDELGDEFGAELDAEPEKAEAGSDADEGDKPLPDDTAAEAEAENENASEAEDDEEITLDFDGEFDLSTDISEEDKKQSNS